MFQIELSKCRYTMQDLDVRHMYPTPSMQVAEGPILVSEMNDGNYFVHDGRHRVIRGLLRQDTLIDAEWLEDHDADVEAQEIKMAILRQQLIGEPDATAAQVLEDLAFSPPTVEQVREAYGFPAPPRATCGRAHWHEAHDCGEHMEEHCSGFPIMTMSIPRYSPSSPRALCGKFHKHPAHDASLPDPNFPEDWCDGIPK